MFAMQYLVDEFFVSTWHLWYQLDWLFYSTIKSPTYIYLDMCNLVVLIFEEVRRSHKKMKPEWCSAYHTQWIIYSPSHPPNGDYASRFGTKSLKNCLCETSASLICPLFSPCWKKVGWLPVTRTLQNTKTDKSSFTILKHKGKIFKLMIGSNVNIWKSCMWIAGKEINVEAIFPVMNTA